MPVCQPHVSLPQRLVGKLSATHGTAVLLGGAVLGRHVPPQGLLTRRSLATQRAVVGEHLAVHSQLVLAQVVAVLELFATLAAAWHGTGGELNYAAEGGLVRCGSAWDVVESRGGL